MIWRTQVSRKHQIILLQISILFFCSIALYLISIKDFSSPMTGAGDEEQWEYAGFYLLKNLKFTPLPQLDLINNQVFYPYGTNSVFQPWGIERDLFYAVFSSLFGIKGWMQIYYFLTVVGTSIASFFLLRRDYGLARAGGASLLVSFFNFYAIHKYPAHLSYAVIHWTVLSLITDFLIVKRIQLKQNLSLRLILVRLCLLVLSMGQELGYIAGFALMSFTISVFYIILTLLYQYLRARYRLINAIKNLFEKYKTEFLKHPKTCLALLFLLGVTTYFYIPLVFQISKEAKSFKFAELPAGFFWTNPYRLLLPYLPNLHPGMEFDKVFGDVPEGLGAGSPGWFLMIIGTIGLWQTRKRVAIFLPLIVIFLLCLFYDPGSFPTLKLFPWFAFNRVPGRVTVIYPVIFTIFALELSFEHFKTNTKRLLTFLLVCLACTELYTAYYLKENLYEHQTFDKNFFNYMAYIKKQPGEAVLDWPFCVTGGNGLGLAQGLCPYYHSINSIHALRRFHEKKVVGQYFGRLHRSQIQPFLQSGWQNLFLPNNPLLTKVTGQARCFNSQEWSFFTDFYKLNDFAGINLYKDLMPEDCVQEFYARFGQPVVETRLASGTKLEFIPKSETLRKAVNPTLGRQIKFEPDTTLKNFAYSIKVFEPPKLLKVSAKAIKLPVFVKNTSDAIWQHDGVNPVRFSYHWLADGSNSGFFGGIRTPFPEVVLPQTSVALNATIEVPNQPGKYTLQLMLVQEQVAWSETKGAKPVSIPVEVVP